MKPFFSPENPETRLALAYVPAQARAALGALFALDERLCAIVAATREPALGAMRLMWWRDALVALDRAPPPGEPLLGEVASVLLPAGATGAALAVMEEGWAAVLEPDAIDESALVQHAAHRGGTLFGIASGLLGEAPSVQVATSGEGWALVDLASRLPPAAAAHAIALARDRLATGERWPRALRPIGMLAMLARRDVADPAGRRPGSPARIARMLAHRLTGR